MAKSDFLSEATAKPKKSSSIFQMAHAVAPLVREHGWSTPLLLVYGFASALAESVGVTLVILFLYSALDRTGDAAQSGGILGRLFQFADQITNGNNAAMIALIFFVIIAKSILNFSYSILASTVTNRISEKIRNGIHAQYMDVAYEYILRYDRGDLLNILASDSWNIANIYISLIRMVVNIGSILVFGVFLIAASWEIAIIAGLGSLVLGLVVHLLSQPARRIGAEAVKINIRLAEQMHATLQGMRTIRAFGREEHEKRLFRHISDKVGRIFVSSARLNSLVDPISEIGYLALLTVIVAISVPLNISFASTLAAVALLYRLRPYMREFQGHWLYLSELETSLAMVRHLLDRSDKPYLTYGEIPFRELQSSIRFEDVGFIYTGASRASLDKAKFTMRRGKKTAIVGPSGSGKTTIVNLLLCLLQPTSGRIFVDNVPLNALDRKSWLSRIAVAGQDVELIEGTIAQNIAMARPDAPLPEIRSAAEVAKILEFADGCSEGFDTWVGEQGLNLSGGQRQRVGIARALLCKPNILIFDEATSALDGDLERAIYEALSCAEEELTLILITHRLETVLSVDHMICLSEAGQVVEQGNPQDLLECPKSTINAMLECIRASAV